MSVLFSTLVDVFANVLSTSMLISDVLALDSAICNKELRASYLDLLSSERVVMDDTMNFEFGKEFEIAKKTYWMSERQLKVKSYQFCEINFVKSLEELCCNNVDLSQTTELLINESFEKADNSLSTFQNSNKREMNLLTLINRCGALCHIDMSIKHTCTLNVFKRMDPLILKQMVYMRIYWYDFNDGIHDVFKYLSTLCKNLEYIRFSRGREFESSDDYFKELDLIRLIEANPNLRDIRCDTLCLSNHILDVLAELTDLRGFQFATIRLDGRLKNNTSISLDSLRYFYAQCAFKGRIHIDIEDVMLFKNIWHDRAERQQNFLDTDVGLELKCDGFSDARFDPSNSDLCAFFYDLGMSFRGTLNLLSLVGFTSLSPSVIDQVACSFPMIEKFRIAYCGLGFCTENNNPLFRMCAKGKLRYIDFDDKYSQDEFNPISFVSDDGKECQLFLRIKYEFGGRAPLPW